MYSPLDVTFLRSLLTLEPAQVASLYHPPDDIHNTADRMRYLNRNPATEAANDQHYQRLETKFMPRVRAYEDASQTAPQAHQRERGLFGRRRQTFMALTQPDRAMIGWPSRSKRGPPGRAASAPLPGIRCANPPRYHGFLRGHDLHGLCAQQSDAHATIARVHRALEGPPGADSTPARREEHRRQAAGQAWPMSKHTEDAMSTAFWVDDARNSFLGRQQAARDALRPPPSAASRARRLRRARSAGDPASGEWRPPARPRKRKSPA